MDWVPKTRLGRMVLNGEITTMSQALATKLPLREAEIVDILLPDLKDEVIDVNIVQRMTDSGRRVKFRITVVVGNGDGFVGIGRCKGKEVGPSIRKAIDNAKLHMIEIKRGCGSWECGCGTPHSLPFEVTGKSGSVEVTLKPAPRGIITGRRRRGQEHLLPGRRQGLLGIRGRPHQDHRQLRLRHLQRVEEDLRDACHRGAGPEAQDRLRTGHGARGRATARCPARPGGLSPMAFAVIRVRGHSKVNHDIEDTMLMMRLNRVNHCVVLPENDTVKGMLAEVQGLRHLGRGLRTDPGPHDEVPWPPGGRQGHRRRRGQGEHRVHLHPRPVPSRLRQRVLICSR